MHQKEYAEILQQPPDYQVWSIENWLAGQIAEARLDPKAHQPTGDPAKPELEYLLLPHCMEQTADKQSAQDWQTIFKHLGLMLDTRAAGCCGMDDNTGSILDGQSSCKNG